jgi:DNA-binding GntR family transcriptional regulator
MMTMIDQLYDRNYQAARAEMNAHANSALAAIASEIGSSLKALHRIEWSAPWTTSPKGAHRV